MALSEQSVISRIEILEDGQIQVRRVTRILRDGEAVSELPPHRHVLDPGADLTNEHPRVQQAATAMWTPEVVLAFVAKKPKA